MGLGLPQPIVNAPANPDREITPGTTAPSSGSYAAAKSIAHGIIPITGNVSICMSDSETVTLYCFIPAANGGDGAWKLAGGTSDRNSLTFDANSVDVLTGPPGTMFYIVSTGTPTEVLVDGDPA